jgi:hypothetical protein
MSDASIFARPAGPAVQVAVLAWEGRHLDRAVGALARHLSVVATDEAGAFEELLADAVCGVVVVEWLPAVAGLRKWRLITGRRSWTPVVLVTVRDAENARAVCGARVAEIVWLTEIETALWPAVQRAGADLLLRRLVEAVALRLPVHEPIVDALACAFAASPPFRSVAELAAALGCNRRTLWRQWQAVARPGVGLRLEDVLDWVLLLHAVGLRTARGSWAAVAAQLGVHPHTLVRTAARLTARPLRVLSGRHQVDLAREFAAKLLGAGPLSPVSA